jgi:isopenicillin-N N-acyltransferase-like protein
MFSDGCTALSWHAPGTSSAFLAQNWDWMDAQAPHLIRLQIVQSGKPSIDMITEAGIIGKIGLNSAGVGVCLNAVRAKGVDYARLPCHLALRAALECTGQREGGEMLRGTGVASSCHILVADESGGRGYECSWRDVVEVGEEAGMQGVITHTNHYVMKHDAVEDPDLEDSFRRLPRIEKLIRERQGEGPTTEGIFDMLKDEEGFPMAICRKSGGGSQSSTLFSIVIDLSRRMAQVKVGRPTEDGETVILQANPEGGCVTS